MSEQQLENNDYITQSKASKAFCVALPLCFILFSLITATVAFIAVTLTDKGSHYLSASWAKDALSVLIVISILIPISALFVYRGQASILPHKRAGYASYIIVAALIYAIYFTVKIGLGDKWDLPFIILLSLSAVFFVQKQSHKHRTLTVLLSFSLLALATVIFALYYFDLSIEINSTYKTSIYFGSVGIMLHTLVDAREAMSRIGSGAGVVLRSISLTLTVLPPSLIFISAAYGITDLPISYSVFSLIFFACSITTIAELISTSISAARLKT